ncbi:metal-dependent hydrolase [Chloroflexota bacterium]
MLLLAHTGITLGLAALISSRRKLEAEPVSGVKTAGSSRFYWKPFLHSKASLWLASLAKLIDVRILFIGALLPDIIDKPLGQLILRDAISNGRIFAHTLLFFIIIALLGLYIYTKQRQLWLLVITFGVLTHLILDSMWETPKTLFWPLYGLAFPKENLGNWVLETHLGLVANPAVYIPEFIGAAILIWFALFLLQRKKTLSFIKCGRIE